MLSSVDLAVSRFIEEQLQPPGRMLTRSTIEFLAVEELGVPVRDVTRALVRGRRVDGPLTLTEINPPGCGNAPTHAYSIGTPDPEQLLACEAVVNERRIFLNPEKLKNTSESYVRAVLLHARDRGAYQFQKIPQRTRLGQIALPATGRRADLVVGYETPESGPLSLLLEVKAHRERFDVTSGIFRKLLDTALREKMMPVLMTAHITRRALDFCRAMGIAVHPFGRRFLPRKDRRQATRLWPRQANRLFQFIRPSRIFPDPDRIDPRSLADLRVISKPSWIDIAHARWSQTIDRCAEVIDALSVNDWPTLHLLLPTYSPTP